MGLIGAAFGLGFIIGPAAGGMLSAGGRYAIPGFMAAGLAALNFFAVLLWVPESLPAERRTRRIFTQRPAQSVRALTHAFGRPGVGPLLMISLFYGLAFAIFEGVFSLHAQRHLALESHETGYMLAYVGVLIVCAGWRDRAAVGALQRRTTAAQCINRYDARTGGLGLRRLGAGICAGPGSAVVGDWHHERHPAQRAQQKRPC